MSLTDTPIEEIERYATDLAERGLELLGEGAPVRVNAVSIAQRAGTEVWAEWTRACCGHRSQIEDFEDPVMDDFEIDALPLSGKMHGTHLESQLRTVRLEGPTHRKA